MQEQDRFKNLRRILRAGALAIMQRAASLRAGPQSRGGAAIGVGDSNAFPQSDSRPSAVIWLTSPSAATSKQPHDEQQQYRSDGGVDDRADHPGTEMDA